MDAKPSLCIVHDCTDPAMSRGLCSTCYLSAYRAIAAGKTSWRKLENRGLAIPSTRRRSLLGKIIKKFKRRNNPSGRRT